MYPEKLYTNSDSALKVFNFTPKNCRNRTITCQEPRGQSKSMIFKISVYDTKFDCNRFTISSNNEVQAFRYIYITPEGVSPALFHASCKSIKCSVTLELSPSLLVSACNFSILNGGLKIV